MIGLDLDDQPADAIDEEGRAEQFWSDERGLTGKEPNERHAAS